ncbi:MAG TPA: hypothetical protein VMT51_13805 [Dongiaceae bacterium]|nr:hypothetical protein [Dongiaceae bacterium]
MNAMNRVAGTVVMAALVFCTGLRAETPKPAASGKASVTVTAIGKKDTAPPAISANDVQLTVGKERKQPASWDKGGPLGLAILIDESLDTTAAGQWDDLRNFIMAQPADTSIAVGYISNSSAMIAQDFTTDHALAAKALRITRGVNGIGSSPYLGVLDLLKRWESNGGRRSILLISSGIDTFRGSWGPIYPDVDSVVSQAEKQNVNIWSIYYPIAGRRQRVFALSNLGQNNLSKLTDETGGELLALGFGPPVSLKPYLDDLKLRLSNQYLLTFAADGGTKGKFTGLRLKTELPDVEFSHASSAWVAPAK